MPRTLAAASSYSSVRAYSSRNFLPRLSLSVMFMLPLFALHRWLAEPTTFLPPFFRSPEISSFWGTLISITPYGNQKVLSTPEVRKYSIGSSLLAFFPSMTLIYHLLSNALLGVATPLTSLFLPPLLPSFAPGRCFRTWVLIINQFYLPSLFLQSTNVAHPSIFKKLVEMTLPVTLTFTVLLQRNTRLFLFPLLLLLFLLLWH